MLLNAVGPLAIDMYLPGFPQVATDLQATAAQVGLTLTGFSLGMAAGQLAGGPVSDQWGRRRPLMAGTLVMLLGSLVCAVAPHIWLLIAARFVTGFGGGWAMVIGRAVLVDLAGGPALIRLMNLMMAIGALAPVVSPLVGGLIMRYSYWRTAFWVLAGAGLVQTLMALAFVPESLPRERRHLGGFTTFLSSSRTLLGHRRYLGFVLVNAGAGITLFAYISTSSFVLQVMHGLSPTAYSIDFAANAVALLLASSVSARLAGRVDTRRVIFTGQCVALAASLVLLGSALVGQSGQSALLVVLICFFLLMLAQGLIAANGAAMASAQVPELAGTASALLGLVQSLAAAITPPLAGLGGQRTALPMAILSLLGAVGGMIALYGLTRPSGEPATTRTAPPA